MSFVVDVWSDVVCPFCYLGSRQLSRALAAFDHADEVVVRHRAFELDPHAKMSYEQDLVSLVARKYGISVEQSRAQHDRLTAEAAKLDLTWHFDRARPTNTFDAHRVIAAGNAQGMGDAITEALFAAYFTQGELVSDHEVLARLAREVGLVGAEDLLTSDRYADVVRADEADALELGISGVPSILLDGRFMVVGARGADEILSVLNRAWARRSA